MTNDESRLRLADYLSHMLEAARLAREYVEGVVKVDFLNDRRTQQAVVLNLITIGEAASRIVSDHSDFAAAHSEIPWAQMRGMRNRIWQAEACQALEEWWIGGALYRASI
jgi:uncharacterized protein with HEPN domain